MWLADSFTSASNLTAIIIAMITAIGGVLASYLAPRRHRHTPQHSDDEDEDTPPVPEPVVRRAARAALDSVSDVLREELVRERKEKDELQKRYDRLSSDYTSLLHSLISDPMREQR